MIGRSLQSILGALLAPRSASRAEALDPVALPVLVLLNGVAAAAALASPGHDPSPGWVCLAVTGCWATAVVTLGVVASLTGVPLGWIQTSRVVALAACPLLLKYAEAAVYAGVTGLSFTTFSAGPYLFAPAAPGWVRHVDVFHLWTAWLLWLFLRERAGSARAGIAVSTVWAAIFLVGWCLGIR